MTTQYVRCSLGVASLSGLVCKLLDFNANDDTVDYTSDSMAAQTNAVGQYVFTFGESAVIPRQWWRVVVVDGSGNLKGDGFGYFFGVDGELVEGQSDPVRLPATVGGASTVERESNDTAAITFRFPVAGATITATRRIGSASSGTACAATATFLETVDDVHFYTFPYNAADRPSAGGAARYKFTDGTYSVWVNFKSVTAVLDSAAILAVADQVWDEAMSGHTTAGTYGGRIVRATNSNTEVQITGSNHIAADIHDLQSGVISAGDFAANAITASALATDAVTEIQTGLASQSSVDTLTSYVDTEVAAIKAKTDNLPNDPADASEIASSFSTVNTKLDTIDDFLDTEIAAIKAKTDNLPADPADQSLVEAAITAATSPLATPAQVNAQVLDVLSVDTFAELSAPPAATSSLKDKITWLFMYARNKVTQTATQRKVYLDDGTTVAGTSATTDNGTTFTKGEDA